MVCCLCALESLAPVAQWDYEASALFSKLDAAAVCDDDRLTFSLFANAPPLRSRQTSDVRVALGHVQLTALGKMNRAEYITLAARLWVTPRRKGRLGVSLALEGRLARRHSL